MGKAERRIPIFKFESNNMEELDAYYVGLQELVESETHSFKPEFRLALSPLGKIRKTFRPSHLSANKRKLEKIM